MRSGYLSQYFTGVVVKRLSAVEADLNRSNQHEFNGTQPLKDLLGSNKLSEYPVTFTWFGEDDEESLSVDSRVTWYDAREKHPTRTEYRLYFKKNEVMDKASAKDLMIIARRPDKSLFIFIIKYGSTYENQMLWLFGIEESGLERFQFKDFDSVQDIKINFTVRNVLGSLGIEVEESDEDELDSLIQPFIIQGFPTTAAFSAYARETLRNVSPQEEPDQTLMAWMDHEEKLFRRLERHIVAARLKQGFMLQDGADVEGFIQFSLSVQNRRKSRVGHALENHLEQLFRVHNVSYARNKVTENNSRPDFLFPSAEAYRDGSFPTGRLSMLGVKSTCKDRWRQVLAEARKIENKHLFTLEPGISENQTTEMKENKLQLVLPYSLHETYKPSQRQQLIGLADFLKLVKIREIARFEM